MIHRILSYLRNYGTDQTADLKIKRDIRMLTMGLLICAVDAAVFAPLNWRAGDIPSTIAHTVISLSLLMVIRVNKTNHKLAFFLTFIIVEFSLFYLAVYAIPKRGIEFYFLLMAFVLHAFSIDRMTYMVMTLMNTGMFGLSLYMAPRLTPDGDYIYTSIALFTVTLLITRLVRIQKGEYEELINEQNQTLHHQSRELQKLSEIKSEFFANISHELRTPLTLLNGQLEALQVKALQPLEKEERVKKAKRNTRQLGQMIDDLLDLSKLELGSMQLSLQPINLVQYVKRLVASFQSLAESQKIVLLVDAPKDVEDAAVMLDTRQFEKVLNNLLYNAFKFTSPGGQTSVKIEKATDHVHINVFNTGNAIPEQELGRLFDRFYQASNNDTNTGSGLGLAIAKEIVELHSGKIFATNVEGGVLFTVNVPSSVLLPSEPEVVSDNSQFGEQVSKPDPVFAVSEVIESKLPGIKSNKPVVLVVEDNEEMQAYVREVLSDYFNLENALNGKEALEKLSTLKPDLILTDVMMPEMNGFELLDKLKKSATRFDIPVMFLTALASQDDKLKGLRMGLDDYLVKPFDREELVIRVTNLISNLRRRIALTLELEKGGEQKNEPNAVTAEGEKLIRKAQAYIESNIADTNLSVRVVAESAGMSERQLYRKVAALMGMTPNEFITEVKLQYARRLLLAGKVVKLSQLAHELGYAKDSHFSNLFFRRFGKRPGDYIG